MTSGDFMCGIDIFYRATADDATERGRLIRDWEKSMSAMSENERYIAKACQVAEQETVDAWSACCNEDGALKDSQSA